MKYFVKIKYLGTHFHGFQVQPNKRTVQGKLSSAFYQLFDSEVKITGCSRTDAGVHANEYFVTAEVERATVPADKLPLAIARFLPLDLSVISAEEVSPEFHPRYNVKSKEYLYRIKNAAVKDPFDCDRVWLMPFLITDDMIFKMKNAARQFVGFHDFSAFMSSGSDVSDTQRTVFYVDIVRNGEYVDIKISADGFLYNMVRIIVGTLVEVAFSRIDADAITDIIKSGNRAMAGPTAPAQGLYLNKVEY